MEETLAFPQWLNLPEPLVELFLERLPLVDYLRFAAVCPKWRSIQRNHRLRHAPNAPPMANHLPWLVPQWLDQDQGLECYSPSDRKSYRLPIPSNLHDYCCLASYSGWLLLVDDINSDKTSKLSFFFNPITATQIPLLPISSFPWPCHVGVMSAAPTDPDCIVLLMIDCYAFLCRPNNHFNANWTIVQLTAPNVCSAVYYRGKFYYSYDSPRELYVIDPFLQKTASVLVMRCPHEASRVTNLAVLQEIGGELFSVREFDGPDGIRRFQVFKADLSWREWVEVETLNDHVLFIGDGDSPAILLAADVGCKRNSIHALKEDRREGEPNHDVYVWGVYDLGTGGWTEEDAVTDKKFETWFIPTLDSAYPAEASN